MYAPKAATTSGPKLLHGRSNEDTLAVKVYDE
jgi:hypothetical protein